MTRFKMKFTVTNRSGVTNGEMPPIPVMENHKEQPTLNNFRKMRLFETVSSSASSASLSSSFSSSTRPSLHQPLSSSSAPPEIGDNYTSRRRKTLFSSLSSSSSTAAPEMMATCRRRDSAEMKSCQTRTVIIDKKTVNSSSCSATLNNNSCTYSGSNSCSSSTSNYKSWTHKITTTLFTLMLTMMTTISARLGNTLCKKRSTTIKNLHHHPRHHTRHYSVTCNCLRRTFMISVIVFGFFGTSSVTSVHGQPPPSPPAGFLDFDNLPVTRFSCEGKVIGGYYADVETGCQMFHVCTLGQKDEIQDIKFLCLNGTVFDQETRVCERVDEVDCSKAEQFFDLNLDLYVPHATTPKPEEADLEEEDDIIRPVKAVSNKPTKPTTTTTTRATTTTTTPTPSPRTRPPSSSLSSKSRAPPVISSSSQSSSSSQQDEEDEEDNPYTSFNYYLKTPHSHVASGYNSQSRQSYIINQPASSRGSSGPSSSPATTNTGRKVSSGSGPKSIVYTSSSTSSSSTARPKTVVVVKATLPPVRSILKPKTLATPRTTTTTTTLPPPKYELDDQYDEYYDDEDYTVEQQQLPPAPSSTSKQSAYQQAHSYPVSKPSYTSSSRDRFDLRDGRSTKGIGNAGQTIISSSTGRTPSISSAGSKVSTVSSAAAKASLKPPVTPIKIISSEFIGNNSTEEPYYYEDDYPDDVTLQQQQEQQLRSIGGYSSTSSSNLGKPSRGGLGTSIRAPTGKVVASTESNSKIRSSINSNKQRGTASAVGLGATDSDYYDDDTEQVNAHDHHFTHVDVPRIPFAKPNVPRVLVTNGKPFLPRLRRQSHYHHYFMPPPLQQPVRGEFMVSAASSPMRQYYHHHHHQPTHAQKRSFVNNIPQQTSDVGGSTNLRHEARTKAREWGRDVFR